MEEYPRVIYGHDAGGTPRCAAVDENGVLNVRLSENSAGTLSVSAVSVAAVSGWKSAAIEVLEECGAKAVVEERIVSLSNEARVAIERGRLSSEGRELLLGAVDALTSRES